MTAFIISNISRDSNDDPIYTDGKRLDVCSFIKKQKTVEFMEGTVVNIDAEFTTTTILDSGQLVKLNNEIYRVKFSFESAIGLNKYLLILKENEQL